MKFLGPKKRLPVLECYECSWIDVRDMMSQLKLVLSSGCYLNLDIGIKFKFFVIKAEFPKISSGVKLCLHVLNHNDSLNSKMCPYMP
jgi:hypothetical protein